MSYIIIVALAISAGFFAGRSYECFHMAAELRNRRDQSNG